MRRREFLGGLGVIAATWPHPVYGQVAAVPVVGSLRSGSRAGASKLEASFRKGLASTGFVEGRSIAIDYRYADSQIDRLPSLVADFVRRMLR
jgi:putative ABC transport system substrate-binding protein